MSTQLALIDDSEREWRIDEHTREVGVRGIAAARDVLRRVPRRPPGTVDDGRGAHQPGRRHAA